MELSHAYITFNATNSGVLWEEIATLKNNYIFFYLPIIWTICAVIFLFTGLKKQLSDFVTFGFALIGLMVGKLYLLDVWRMEKISRIIAFIMLGIILLSSSFLYQKLKGIFQKMREKEE
jgi:uncharacterized membrane protein